MATKRAKPEATEMAQDELVALAINEPAKETISINGLEFELKDFKYKEYMAFIRYMTPLMEVFTSKLTTSRMSLAAIDGDNITVSTILTFCEDTLPKMALMVAQHSYPDMTEEELLDRVPSPFELASLVLAQIAKNQIIEKLAGFLQLMTPKTK